MFVRSGTVSDYAFIPRQTGEIACLEFVQRKIDRPLGVGGLVRLGAANIDYDSLAISDEGDRLSRGDSRHRVFRILSGLFTGGRGRGWSDWRGRFGGIGCLAAGQRGDEHRSGTDHSPGLPATVG